MDRKKVSDRRRRHCYSEGDTPHTAEQLFELEQLFTFIFILTILLLQIAHEKEINAAHKFIVGQISQAVAKKLDIRVAPTVTEAIVKLSQGYLEEVAADAEAFSK